jgi:hypothetical protein
VAKLVDMIRDVADSIERESAHNLANAAQKERPLEFQTYPRVVGNIANKLNTLSFNSHLDNRIDAAADAEAARVEKTATAAAIANASSLTREADKLAGAADALSRMLGVLDGWIEGARSNHDGMGHRGEPRGEECWTQYAPADIRRMINDAAREAGLSEFTAPTTLKEDEVR